MAYPRWSRWAFSRSSHASFKNMDCPLPFAPTTAIRSLLTRSAVFPSSMSGRSSWSLSTTPIKPQRISPGQPQQNGRHERMHRTLKAETARPPDRNQATQQVRFDVFRAEFNEERPHEALDQKTPASVYVASLCPMPSCLPSPEYAAHLEVRRVSHDGTFRFTISCYSGIIEIDCKSKLFHPWLPCFRLPPS